jgi:mono/diheme cytochrome c family protein
MKISTVSLCVLLGAAYPAGAGDPGAEFFEKKIRPLLVEHCYACHSKDAKKQRGGLLLDTRAGLRKGGETGPAIVPGKPKESLLIKAVRHLDPELKMPRDGKLSEAAIADLEQWIAMGAPDPRDDDKGAKAIDWTSARRHWSFQPIREPDLPAVKNTPWASSPIDRFIAAKLEDKGLSPSPPADPRTLLRRIHYDLIGLPPSPEEVAAFQKAAIGNPQSAIENVIDHLLASPHYGERWGRHWLDVARYADTKDGVLMFGDDRVRPYAYTYRDYVIKAFNEDSRAAGRRSD